MKRFSIIFLLLFIIPLSACISQSKSDINALIFKFNEINSTKLYTERLSVKKTDRYKYSYMYNNHTLLCFYCGDDGIITQCTITSDEENIKFSEICENISSAFTGMNKDEIHKNFLLIKNGGRIKINEYMMVMNKSNVCRTFIINYADDKINTNEYPTLKGYIDKKDISRPTDVITSETEKVPS